MSKKINKNSVAENSPQNCDLRFLLVQHKAFKWNIKDSNIEWEMSDHLQTTAAMGLIKSLLMASNIAFWVNSTVLFLFFNSWLFNVPRRNFLSFCGTRVELFSSSVLLTRKGSCFLFSRKCRPSHNLWGWNSFWLFWEIRPLLRFIWDH